MFRIYVEIFRTFIAFHFFRSKIIMTTKAHMLAVGIVLEGKHQQQKPLFAMKFIDK